MKRLSVVVPVFNEAETLPHTVSKLYELRVQIGLEVISEIEYIYVDDGSSDGSSIILRDLAKKIRQPHTKMVVLKLSRNFGHSAAVLAGLESATGEYISIIDADLQDPPHLIPEMLKELTSGNWDVIYGQRLKRNGEGFFKLFTAWLFYRLLGVLTGVDIPRDSGDFRVITKEVKDAVLSCGDQEPFLRGLVAWVGFRQKSFGYIREERKYGTSKYPFRKMLRFAIMAIVSFSSFPLLLAIYIGLVGLAFTVLVMLYAIYIRISGEAVPGWASLLVGYSFGQSLTLLLVGVVGLYISKIHRQVQNRPRYILAQKGVF